MESSCTLLLTDLVDSTALNARLGDAAMTAVWDAHDRVSRELARRFGGREVDRSDGFLMLFDRPADAAAFAHAYHVALAALPVPLQARAGLHVGPLTLREASAEDRALGAKPFEVVGLAKAITARLMTLARGGQTLASADAAALLRDGPGRCVSHGFWRFKGIDEPAEVFECGDGHAPFVPPQAGDKAQPVVQAPGGWIGLAEVPRCLPPERDAFVGRADALAALATRLDEGARLVLLLGPGGIGKTRLALRHGWGWLGRYPGGVYFCDLAAARSADGVAHAVARAFEVPLGAAPVAQLGHVIAGRGRCLVILDNFEQVAAEAPATLGAWLDAAPQARFVVTSRAALGLAGEQALVLEPLPTADAVALFHARAQAVNQRYDPAAVPAATSQALAGLLDGLPLALELAAARTALLAPEQLLARMGQRLRLLAAQGGRPERQATLRAAIEWSWDLLQPAERSAFAQLAVFEGGFTLAAAEAVVRVDGDDAPWLLDLLQSLVGQSLLRADGRGRFGMLSTIQEFAAEHADDAPRRRHWRHFAALDEATLLADRWADLDNVVTACRRATAAGDTAAAVALLRLAWDGLRPGGLFGTALALANAVLALPALQATDRGAAHWVAGAAQFSRGDLDDAHRLLLLALDGLGPGAHGELAARVNSALGSVESVAGRMAAAGDSLDRAWALAYPLGLPSLSCQVLNAKGALAFDQGRLDDARAFYEQALAIADGAGIGHWQSGLAGNLGSVHYAAGRLDAAEQAFERSLALARASGDRRWQGSALTNLGVIAHDRGDTARALAHLQPALDIARANGQRGLEHTVHCVLGLVHQLRGDLAAAQREFGHAVDGAETLGHSRSAGEFRSHLGQALSHDGRHAEARACLARAVDLLAGVGDRLSLARAWCSVAENEHRAGDGTAAQAALDAALHIEAEAGWGSPSPIAEDLARARATLSRG